MQTIFNALTLIATGLAAYAAWPKKPQIFSKKILFTIANQQGHKSICIDKIISRSDKKVMFFEANSDPVTGAAIGPHVRSFISPGNSMSVGRIIQPGEMVTFVIAESEDGVVGSDSRPLSVTLEKAALFSSYYNFEISLKQ